LWASLKKVFNVDRFKEIAVGGEVLACPEKPPTSSELRLMAQPIERVIILGKIRRDTQFQSRIGGSKDSAMLLAYL